MSYLLAMISTKIPFFGRSFDVRVRFAINKL